MIIWFPYLIFDKKIEDYFLKDEFFHERNTSRNKNINTRTTGFCSKQTWNTADGDFGLIKRDRFSFQMRLLQVSSTKNWIYLIEVYSLKGPCCICHVDTYVAELSFKRTNPGFVRRASRKQVFYNSYNFVHFIQPQKMTRKKFRGHYRFWKCQFTTRSSSSARLVAAKNKDSVTWKFIRAAALRRPSVLTVRRR